MKQDSFSDSSFQTSLQVPQSSFVPFFPLNINGNISEHDPRALEQAIEEATHNSYLQDKNLCFCFSITKRVEV